jgi:GNAT superfamily N-acetyltransferase
VLGQEKNEVATVRKRVKNDMGTYECHILNRVDDMATLCKLLGDIPETVLWTHGLRRSICNAYIAGDLLTFRAVIVQATNVPGEPTGFGPDVNALWELLGLVKGWKCIAVDRVHAFNLGNLIYKNTGLHVRYLGDLHYTLSGKAPAFMNQAVRLLTIDDLELLEASPPELYGSFWGSTQALLTEGITAGAIVEGKVVATARLSSISERYADIAVDTLPDFRGQGLATAAASVVVRATQEMGRTPIWSTGEHNIASRRIAEKLGFVEIQRRAYVIPENSPSFDKADEAPPD